MPEAEAALNCRQRSVDMLILAFDTSLQSCSVALWRDGVVLARDMTPMSRGQAEVLVPTVQSVMATAGVEFADLDRIAATTGPGSFTGIRVGLATARGFALAAGKPALGIPTTEALAAAVDAKDRVGFDRIVSAIDSQRGDVFAQAFSPDLRAEAAPINSPITSLGAWFGSGRTLVVSDGAEMIKAAWPDVAVSTAAGSCDPAVVARLAADRSLPSSPATPVYVRPPDVTMSVRVVSSS